MGPCRRATARPVGLNAMAPKRTRAGTWRTRHDVPRRTVSRSPVSHKASGGGEGRPRCLSVPIPGAPTLARPTVPCGTSAARSSSRTMRRWGTPVVPRVGRRHPCTALRRHTRGVVSFPGGMVHGGYVPRRDGRGDPGKEAKLDEAWRGSWPESLPPYGPPPVPRSWPYAQLVQCAISDCGRRPTQRTIL